MASMKNSEIQAVKYLRKYTAFDESLTEVARQR